MPSVLAELWHDAPALVIGGALVLAVAAVWLVNRALGEGREVSFWPPRVGARPSSSGDTPSARSAPGAHPDNHGPATGTRDRAFPDHPPVPSVEVPSTPIAALRVEGGANAGTVYLLTEDRRTVTLGRGNECDLAFPDPVFSRTHARINVTPASNPSAPQRSYLFELIDTGSANGTFLNGERIHRASLADSDLIQVGGVRIRFTLFGQPLAAQPAPGADGRTQVAENRTAHSSSALR